MAEAASISAQPKAGMTAEERHWMLRRLHSLSGIVPIGGFLFFHIFENAYVLRGAQMWWRDTEFTRSLPLQIFIEAGLLWIPITYHAVYGLVITMTSAPNTTGYAYERNLQYTLQRVTGILAMLFISFHVLSTRGWFYYSGVETDFARMHSFMINPVFLSIYIVGTLSCVYHLCNGIFTFCITWGLTIGPNAQRLINRACMALFLVLAAVSVSILIAFRTPA